ncbi:DUF6622 family protein [Pseudoalteromonas rubra]|uniref:DUF1453 domain-containing protein n=1 Tax=Pseudoalteromonas rubra TaxID=43658 RepID=A0A0F4QRS5_9GAMM|nr:DUF6622 family protein [Pseudoalteromonas rubra]KJZ10049.1 hypothetical protein TW77_07300 [Pseudoalteromonas rubra]
MIFEILKHTPRWLFGLFLFLIVLGFQQLKDRTVNKILIFPLPVGMIFMSYAGVRSSFGFSLGPVGLWFFGVASTTAFLASMFPVKGLKYHADVGKLLIPGSCFPLVFMMAIFFTKYIVGVMNVLAPTWVSNIYVIYLCSFVYGAFSGVFFARAVSMWLACNPMRKELSV